jgi:ABC-type nitrate/sulfonate/bicarbonate transport system substrate-binding protein
MKNAKIAKSAKANCSSRSWRPSRSLAAVVAAIAVATIWSASCNHARDAPTIIRVGYSGEADFSDLPSLLAQTRLRAQGFHIESTFFSGTSVAVAEVSRGTVDIMNGSMIGVWMAISRGAAVRTIMDHTADPYRFVTGPGIAVCAALNGRRVGLATESSVSTHLVRAYLADECPSASPEVLTIGESSNRVAAFLAGGIDAAGLELSSWLWLQKQAPGRFVLLSDFSKRWPTIKTTGVHVNTTFARAHRDLVDEYVRAVLAANRDVLANPDLLVSAANEHMGRAEDWTATARAYIDAAAWSQRGGLTRQNVESTLTFFQSHSRLDTQLTAGDVADLAFLDKALADTHE